jgi:hypothetical protein
MKATERQFYLAVILILTAIIFTQRACSPKCSRQHCDELKGFKPIEVTAIDTVIEEKKDSSQWHQPKKVLVQREPSILDWIDYSDTSLQRIEESQKKDSLAVSDWNLARFYSDTNNVEAGKVIVEAMVTKNRLGNLRVLTDLKQKTITVEKTVTNYIQAKPKGQMYFGIVAQGDQNDLLTGFGVSSVWKTKRDKIWTVSALYDRRFQTPVYQFGTYFKLKLHK